jgi:uncharacterized membrane protein
MTMRLLLNAGLLILTILYPVGIYLGIQYIEPRYLVLALASLFALRFLLSTNTSSQNKKQQLILLIAMAVFTTFVFISNSLIGLRFYPVLVSTVLLSIFSYTLFNPPSMIERLARLTDPNLPDSAIPYTKNVTIVWCLFFIANGSIAVFTSLFSSMEIWSLYNGCISYILMGCIFAIEYLVRRKVRKQHQ